MQSRHLRVEYRPENRRKSNGRGEALQAVPAMSVRIRVK